MPPKKQLKVEGGEIVIAQKSSTEATDHDYLAEYQSAHASGNGFLQVNKDDQPRYVDYSNLPDSDDDGCTVRICVPNVNQSSSVKRERTRSRDRKTSTTSALAVESRPVFAPMHIAKVRKGVMSTPEPKATGAKLSDSMLKMLGKDPATAMKSSSATSELSAAFEDPSKVGNDEAQKAAEGESLKDKYYSGTRPDKLHTGLDQKKTHLTGAAELRRQQQDAPKAFGLDGVSAAALASGLPPPPPVQHPHGMMSTPSGNIRHCYDYKMRKCTRGALCRFLHAELHPYGAAQSSTMLSMGAGAPPVTMALNFDPRLHKNHGDWCCPGCMRAQFKSATHCRKCGCPKPEEPSIPVSVRNATLLSVQPGQPEPCMDFKAGRCSRGASCRFFHLIPGVMPQSIQTPGGSSHVKL